MESDLKFHYGPKKDLLLQLLLSNQLSPLTDYDLQLEVYGTIILIGRLHCNIS